MELDDMKKAWAAHGALLERSLAIDERLLRETTLRKVRTGLAPHALGLLIEAVLGAAILAVVAPLLVAHAAEPRYLLAGVPFAAFAAAIAASSAYLMVSGLVLDYAGPVTAIQREVERLRRVEYRSVKWAVLGGVLFWLPGLLLLFEAATGVGVLARVDLSYLAANLAFGLAVLGAGLALSRRYVERPDLSPGARKLVDALTGRGLRRAAAHLAELSRFEREDESAS